MAAVAAGLAGLAVGSAVRLLLGEVRFEMAERVLESRVVGLDEQERFVTADRVLETRETERLDMSLELLDRAHGQPGPGPYSVMAPHSRRTSSHGAHQHRHRRRDHRRDVPSPSGDRVPIGMFGFDDLPGGTVPVAYNWNSLIASGSLGALLFHHFNATSATRAQELDVTNLSIGDASVLEGHTGTADLAFTVTRTGDLSQTSTVGFATSDGTGPNAATAASGDYIATAGTLTFAPGVATQVAHVAVNGDATIEPDETMTVTSAPPPWLCFCTPRQPARS